MVEINSGECAIKKIIIKRCFIHLVFISELLSFSSVLADISDPNVIKVGQHLVNIIKEADNQRLHDFLVKMPKGGDLHNHLGGAAYPRWLLSYAKRDTQGPSWCVDATTYEVTKTDNCIGNAGILLQTLELGSFQYNEIIRHWSMKDFTLKHPNYGHKHFFSAMRKILPLVHHYIIPILADFMKQAAEENISYLEIMVRNDTGKHTAAKYAGKITVPLDSIDDVTYENVKAVVVQLEKLDFTNNVVRNTILYNSRELLLSARRFFGSASNAHNVEVKFKYATSRQKPLTEVLTGIYAGFVATILDPDLFVGVDLVGEEDNSVALENYNAHMLLIHYLRQYLNNSNFHVSLHAGELTDRLSNIVTDPLSLTYHIYNATKIAGANRIGHGVDVFAELPYHFDLIESMKNNHTAVEVCLTSNEQILGVCDGEPYCMPIATPYNPPNQYQFNHAFYYYLTSGVPVVLVTDDQGIEQTDLTKEYYKAVTRYGLTYQQLKDIARNSLVFSFLLGQHVWDTIGSHGDYVHFVPQCSGDNPYDTPSPSAICRDYLNKNPRAKLEWDLEDRFSEFEKVMVVKPPIDEL